MNSFGTICYLKKLVDRKTSTHIFLYIGIFFIIIFLFVWFCLFVCFVQTDPLLKFICLIFILFCSDALWISYFFQYSYQKL